MDVRGFLSMRRIVNTFGAIGYTLLIFSYTITLGVVLLWLVQGGHMEFIGVSPAQPPAVVSVVREVAQPTLLWKVVTYLITALMVVTVVFVMATLPYWLGRSGSRVLKRAIRYCQRPVTLSSLLAAKALACGVGAVPIVIGGLYMGLAVAVTITLLIVTGLALLIFLIQHYLAKTSEVVVAKDVW